jgi:putative transposase
MGFFIGDQPIESMIGFMRRARLKVPSERAAAFYHCVSRVVDRRFIFQEAEKEHFVALLRECEAFCEVRVLTFCLMSNHFHILVEVPQKPDPESMPGEERVLEKLSQLSGHQDVGAVRQRFEMYRSANDAGGAARYLATFHARMWNVSAFIGMLKQRFSLWYNVRTGRRGTLWEERFRSVLVEGAGLALATMAAYIDLNPVRARIVEDPKDYRWSGYGEAMGGRRQARLGIQFLAKAIQRGAEESLQNSLEIYRSWLYQAGDERLEAVGEDGALLRGSLGQDEVVKVLASKGELPLSEYLKCRVRYFSDGAAFGSREFVDGVFGEFREQFGKARRSGARRVRGLAEGGLYTLRDLRRRVFG